MPSWCLRHRLLQLDSYMQEDGGQICSCTVGADLGFKEMQAAVMAELSAELQQRSQAAEIDSNLIRTASLRTQA